MSKKSDPPDTAPLGAPPTLPRPSHELPAAARQLMEEMTDADTAPSMSATQAQLRASIARNQHVRQKRRQGVRDYSIAHSMIEGADSGTGGELETREQRWTESGDATPPPEMISDNLSKDVHRQGYVRGGVGRGRDQSKDAELHDLIEKGVTGALVGHDPDGGAMFELMFEEGIFQGMRCSLLMTEAGLQATFHLRDGDDGRRFEGRVGELRAQLESRGIYVHSIQVTTDITDS